MKEFEAAVFSLGEKQMSGLVETEFGIHIIQLLDRRGDAVHPRHILIRVSRTESSDQIAVALLDSIRTAVLAGANFTELAKKYSQDESTAPVGGDLGTAELEAIPDKSLYATVLPMKAGEISRPEKLQTDGAVKAGRYAEGLGFEKIIRCPERVTIGEHRSRGLWRSNTE